jgi:hypothetical protein
MFHWWSTLKWAKIWRNKPTDPKPVIWVAKNLDGVVMSYYEFINIDRRWKQE